MLMCSSVCISSRRFCCDEGSGSLNACHPDGCPFCKGLTLCLRTRSPVDAADPDSAGVPDSVDGLGNDRKLADLAVRTTSKGQTVALFKLEGDPEEVTCVVFPKLFSARGDLLANGAPVRVSGGLESSGDYIQLVCRQIDSLA